MSRRTELQELGRDAAELAMRLERRVVIGDDERRIVLASMIRAILGTGMVTMDDVEAQLAHDDDLVDEAHGVNGGAA